MPIHALAVLRAVWAFLRRYWRVLAVLLILLITWFHGYGTGAESANARWEYVTAKEAARNAEALAKAEAAARQQEQQWAALYEAHTAQLLEDNRNVAAHRDRLLSAARAGRLRLPTCPAAGMPEAAAGAATTEAGAEGGQSAMVGELVNRLAACDEVTLERNMAVELLRGERR